MVKKVIFFSLTLILENTYFRATEAMPLQEKMPSCLQSADNPAQKAESSRPRQAAQAMIRPPVAQSNAETPSQELKTMLPRKKNRIVKQMMKPIQFYANLSPIDFTRILHNELYRQNQVPSSPRINYAERYEVRLMTPAEIYFLSHSQHPWVKSGTQYYRFGVIDSIGEKMIAAWMALPELQHEQSSLDSPNASQNNVGQNVLKLLKNGISYDLIFSLYDQVDAIISELPSETKETAATEIWELVFRNFPFKLIQQAYTNVKIFISTLSTPQQERASKEIWPLLRTGIPFEQIMKEYARVDNAISALPCETEDIVAQRCLASAEFWTLLRCGISFDLIKQEYMNVRTYISDLRCSYLKNVSESKLYKTVSDIWKLLCNGIPLNLIKNEYFKVQAFIADMTAPVEQDTDLKLLWHFLRNEIPFVRATELYTLVRNTALLISEEDPYQFHMILAHSIAPNETQLSGYTVKLGTMLWSLAPGGAIKLLCDGDESNMKTISAALQQGINVTELRIQNTTMQPFPNEVIAPLCEALKNSNCKLQVLDLSSCSINNLQAKSIAAALKRNSSLSTLHLSGNDIQLTGLKAIADMLKINTAVTHLYLDNNEIPNTCEQHVLNLLNSKLKYLNLRGNWISFELRQKLEASKPQSLELLL